MGCHGLRKTITTAFLPSAGAYHSQCSKKPGDRSPNAYAHQIRSLISSVRIFDLSVMRKVSILLAHLADGGKGEIRSVACGRLDKLPVAARCAAVGMVCDTSNDNKRDAETDTHLS